MKKILLFLCTMLCANLLLAQTSFADEEAETSTGIRRTTFWIDSLRYRITSTNPAEVEVNVANALITIANIPTTVSYEGINYSVTAIGDYAFYGCSSLTSITIPNSVTSIGECAFESCDGLISVDIPNSVTSIGDDAFYSCSSLTSIDIPNSVTSIGSYTFRGCSSLTSIDIPSSVTSIGNGAFCDCSSLISIDIPNGVTSIEASMFAYCSSLTSIDIPNSVTSIGSYTFRGCSSLTSIDIPSSVTSIGNGAFCDCSSLISIDIPNGVTSIEASMFAYCSSLTSIDIPNGVTSIIDGAFAYCSSLTSITIPNSVTYIGNYAFWNCSSLTSITIPNNVTSIGYYAFSDCSSLTSVTCLAETAPSLGESVFSYTSSTKVLNIPFGSDYSSWQGATDWSKTNYLIQEGETKELSNDFTINSTTGLINQGVLRIKQSGQLINSTGTNVSGIFEVETPTLANNKWSFIGAPFNNYKLEAVKPGTKDISISLFDYTTGNWSNDFATIEDEVGAGEGFFAWSFAEEPTTFTTDGEIQDYTLNNGVVTVTKTLKTHTDGGNWIALANPYTFKLDVAKFLANQTNVQGGVVYKFDGTQWQTVSTGEINVTEGFFVNFTSNGTQTSTFNKAQRYTGTNQTKASKEKDFIRLTMNDGERTTRLLFAQNDKAEAKYDIFDANKLFSPIEITEPYFVTDGVALVKEEVNTLPYTANLNIRNYQTKEVTISIDNIPEGVNVFLLDNGQDIKMNGGVEYTTTITTGENADRFQLLVKKQQKIESPTNNQITIKNNNRQITITSDITNLNIEVYNNLGQKVYTTKDYNFTLDQVPAGSYVIKAFYGRVNQSQKIIVE